MNLFRRVVSGSFPGHEESINSTHCAVSSWAAFYKEMNLKDCKEVYHLPVLFDFNIGVEDLFVIFKSNPK